MLNEASLREFYGHVFPVELLITWLSYNIGGEERWTAESAGSAATGAAAVKRQEPNVDEGEESAAVSGGRSTPEGYLARREFCFTLLGDIFTRFRSFGSAAELRAELLRCFPEKVDVGAVYNVRPNQKQGIHKITAVERELVFDIDMSDYDNVRSCCTGKTICSNCWPWMSCAANVLHTILEEDFGFKHFLAVFSGRRGVHLWVCDRRARAMHNDERAAIVGYLTVVAPKTLRSSVVADLANHRPVHPSIRGVLTKHIEPTFLSLFVYSAPENPNNILTSPKAAAVVYDAVLSVLKLGRREQENKFRQSLSLRDNETIDYGVMVNALGGPQEARDVLHGAQLLLLYPRLDEHVSTMREHLLKLPFCVHPGTGSLCCPLRWESLESFNPISDAPRLDAILLERRIDERWTAPLRDMLQEMQEDPEEAASP